MAATFQRNDRIALVTGATRGIGLETVRQLAASGVHTLLAGRDRARAVEAALALQAEGLPVEAIALDVTDEASISAAADEVSRRHGHLDILVNNAGIFRDDPDKAPSAQTLQVWRDTFDTNLFGVVATTQAFLPLLHRSSAGRIVNLSSSLASLALHNDPQSAIYAFKVPAYDASKTAVNAWTVHLAYELRDTAIKVSAVDPGSVKTDMNQSGELDVATGARGSVMMALLDGAGPTGSVRVARPGVTDQHRVGGGGVELAPRLVRQRDVGERDPALDRERAVGREREEPATTDGIAGSPGPRGGERLVRHVGPFLRIAVIVASRTAQRRFAGMSGRMSRRGGEAPWRRRPGCRARRTGPLLMQRRCYRIPSPHACIGSCCGRGGSGSVGHAVLCCA